MGKIGGSELLLLLLVVLLFFGAKRIPELARSLGRSMGEFKKGKEEGAMPDDRGRPEDNAGKAS